MIRLILILCFILTISLPSYALEITAPTVPQQGALVMPENTESFTDALRQLVQKVIMRIRPDLAEAYRVSIILLSITLIVSLLNSFSDSTKKLSAAVGTGTIGATLIINTQAMIGLASETIRELSNYGKLLFPVMTAAMAAQGGITSSTALYTATAAFDAILSGGIANLFVPMVYLYLALAMGNSVTGEALLKRIQDFIKSIISWSLKTLLTVYTTYISITGVVSGTTDAAALKATKITISSFVPVVGGIMSDASESILVSAGLLKNSAGIYGILAVLALFLEPFLRIGIQYLMLKVTASFCAILGSKEISALIDDFGAGMGLLLAMTGAVCLLLLISIVCFLKGVG